MTLALPTNAWAVMTLSYRRANPYKFRTETGGWLIAREEEPTRIVAATGPGRDGKLEPGRVWFSRAEFDPAVRKQGFGLVGEWHLHPDGGRVGASEGDKAAWRHERELSGVERWPAVVLARGKAGTWASGSAKGFVTTRDGCEPVDLVPHFGPAVVEAAGHQSAWVGEGPLLRWPSTWEPGVLRRAVDMLEVDEEMYQRVKLQDLNERCRRLGIKTQLRPVSPLASVERRTTSTPAARATPDPGASEIIYGGPLLVRPGIGRIVGIR